MPIDFATVRARARELARETVDRDAIGAGDGAGDLDARATGDYDYDDLELNENVIDDDVFATHATTVIPGISLCDEFIDEDTARALEGRVMQEPASSWTMKTRGRRVMNSGGASPSAPYRDEDARKVPMYAKTMMRYVFRRGAAMKEPNHVLVNEYEANAGVTPHSDGDAYEEDAAILTLRGRAMIEFWPSEGASGGDEGEGEPVVSFVLEPRSLLMYRGDAYRLRHGIRERGEDVVTRTTANARALGLEVGDVIKRNPLGRLSVVFVRKKRADSVED